MSRDVSFGANRDPIGVCFEAPVGLRRAQFGHARWVVPVAVLVVLAVIVALSTYQRPREAARETGPPSPSGLRDPALAAPPRAPASAPDAEMTPPAPPPREEGTWRLFGTVQDDEGRPIPDIGVRWIESAPEEFAAWSHDGALWLNPVSPVLPPHLQAIWDRTRSTLTAAEGQYEILVASRATAGFVVAAGRGYELVQKSVARPAGESGVPLEIELDFTLRFAGTISGWVTEAGTTAGAAGMLVHAGRIDPDTIALMSFVASDAPRAMVREDGRYVLTGLTPGEYRVVPRGGESDFVSVPSSRGKKVVLGEKKIIDGIDFQVTRGGRIYGHVSDREGRPVEGARCSALPENFMLATLEGNVEALELMDEMAARSTVEGAFEIRGLELEESYVVLARKDGFAPTRSDSIELTMRRSQVELTVVLTLGSTISGRVKYPDDRSAPAVSVRLIPDLGGMMAGSVDSVAEVQDATESDAFGEFTFEHLPAGEFHLYAGELKPYEIYKGSKTTPVSVDGIEDVTDVELTVVEPDDARGIAGIVRDDRGAAVSGATVRVVSTQNLMNASHTTVQSGARGEFIIEVDGEGYSLTATKDGYTPVALPHVAAGDAVLDLILGRNGRIEGQVVPPPGIPLGSGGRAKAKLVRAAETPDFLESMTGGRARRSEGTPLARDGSFSVESPAGSVAVHIAVPGFAPATSAAFDVRPGEEVTGIEIPVSTGAVVRGKVTFGGSTGVEGAAVTLREVGDDDALDMFREMMPQFFATDRNRILTDFEGHFEVRYLAPGEYKVVADHALYAPSGELTVSLRRDEIKNLAPLVLSTGGSVVGRIHEAGGEPKSGLMVQLVGTGPAHMATSDGRGRFEFKALKAGSYIVQVLDLFAMRQGKMVAKASTVTVEEDAVSEVEVVFGRGHRVFGTVQGLPPAPLRMIQLRRPGGLGPEEFHPLDMAANTEATKYLAGVGIIDGENNYEIPDVEPGDYILEVLKMPKNPMDMSGYAKMDRTPYVRTQIRVDDEDVEHDIELP